MVFLFVRVWIPDFTRDDMGLSGREIATAPLGPPNDGRENWYGRAASPLAAAAVTE